MKLSQKIACIAVVLTAAPLAALAEDMGTVYTQIGFGGLGIGYAKSVSPDWAVRGQYNALPKQKFTGDVGDFGSGSSLTVEFDWNSIQLTGDWYPGAGGFRLSGGVVFNNSKLTLAGTGKVGNNAANSTIDAEIKMSDSVAPYAGIGYSTRPKEAKGFGFTYDLGLMFQNPKVTLNASGGGVTAAQIEEQRVKVQDAINNLKVMPVFNFGISYSF